MRRVEQGRPIIDSSSTLAAWLERWQSTALAASDRRPGTVDTYERSARLYITPAIGGVKLREFKAHHVESMLTSMTGKSGSTRRLALQVLRQALDGAVRDGLRPRQTPVREATWYRPEQVKALLSATVGARLHAMAVTVAYLGLRRGEALALRWSDVDLEASTLTVSGTLSRDGTRTLVRSETKTARSRRTLPLPEPVRAALVEHRRSQASERLLVGESWLDTGAVFATQMGGWTEPRTAARWYAVVADNAGVGGSWHSLRHSAETTLLAAGVPMRVVSDILGHADVRTTLAVYGHVGAEHLEDAVARMTQALG